MTLPTIPPAADESDAGALFDAIEPFNHGHVDVGDGHQIYFEECGAPDGMPVLFLHGGPGSGCSARHRQLLDPALFRVVLFDQRGCGRSTPRGEIAANTTDYLVADIERLRSHLGIERWLVFGGSWGSSLALVYCARHPDACSGAILRGIFLTGQDDLDWFFRGAAALLPVAWERLVDYLDESGQEDIAQHYLDALRSPDRLTAARALQRWMQWEAALSSPGRLPPAEEPLSADALDAALDKYRVQAHYLANHCFIGEAEALRCAGAMAGMPVAILHGRLDFVCRPANARKLQHALPGSRLRFIDDAGHSPFDAPMVAALVEVAGRFHARGSFDGWGDSWN